MAKAKSAAADGADAAKRKSAASTHSSTRMLVVMAVGAVMAVVSSMFYNSFSSEWSSTLSGILRSAPSTLEDGLYTVGCKDSYDSVGSCSPPPFCARAIHDDFLGAKEVAVLRQMAELGMSFGRGAGGPTIFDVVSGAASKGEAFVDVYAILGKMQDQALAQAANPLTVSGGSTSLPPVPAPQLFTPLQLSLYRSTMSRVKDLLESQLNVTGLHLTSPSFFSRITSARAITAHDEYWHAHVDKVQYGSFVFTGLIYLSTQGRDFEGGDFVFTDSLGAAPGSADKKRGGGSDAKGSSGFSTKESRVKPQSGRLVFFTSGAENTHYVSPVTSGTRIALTIAFTCDASKSVENSLLKRADALLEKQAAAEPKRLTLKEILEQEAAAAAVATQAKPASDSSASAATPAPAATPAAPETAPTV